jgi:hypothetical protein
MWLTLFHLAAWDAQASRIFYLPLQSTACRATALHDTAKTILKWSVSGSKLILPSWTTTMHVYACIYE